MADVVEFGIEQEHFVLHDDVTPPDHAEIDTLYDRLRAYDYSVRATDAHGRVLAVERAIDGRPLIITNDACTHTLEVAFPPLRSLDRFRELYAEVFGLLGTLFTQQGLKLVLGGMLDPPPSQIHWRPSESDSDGVRLRNSLQRPIVDHPLFYGALPSCIAATQVSLTVTESDAYQRLAAYYAFDFLVPLYFANSPSFRGVTAHCVRPLAWMANFPRSYPLAAIPAIIPSSAEEYLHARKQSVFRDYSFVSVRSSTRLEFRSACSQNTVDDIADLILFRSAVERTVRRGVSAPPFSPRQAFTAACIGSHELPLDWARDRLKNEWPRLSDLKME